MDEFELIVAEEYEFEYWRKWIKKHFVEFSDCQDSDAGNTYRQFSDRNIIHN